MRFEPGFAASLREDMSNVDPVYRARLGRPYGLSESHLVLLATRTTEPVCVDVELPVDRDVTAYESIATADCLAAEEAIKAGRIAYVVLAGGAGTRLGGPKALARLPGLGLSLLAHKVLSSAEMPLWIMTSAGITGDLLDHLRGLQPLRPGSLFEQYESYRLTPDNRIAFLSPGVPDMHPTGHGDVGSALVESGILDDNPQVTDCIIVNIDNALASPDLRVLGHHLASRAQVTCEIVERHSSDRGGCPVWHDDRLQVMESFRLADEIVDASRWHNTNTMIVSTKALRTVLPWRYHRVRKTVGKRLVVQHERLLQQYTESFEAQYVAVPRESRYLPIKDEIALKEAGRLLNWDLIK